MERNSQAAVDSKVCALVTGGDVVGIQLIGGGVVGHLIASVPPVVPMVTAATRKHIRGPIKDITLGDNGNPYNLDINIEKRGVLISGAVGEAFEADKCVLFVEVSS